MNWHYVYAHFGSRVVLGVTNWRVQNGLIPFRIGASPHTAEHSKRFGASFWVRPDAIEELTGVNQQRST